MLLRERITNLKHPNTPYSSAITVETKEKIDELGREIDKRDAALASLVMKMNELQDLHGQQMNVYHNCRVWWFNNRHRPLKLSPSTGPDVIPTVAYINDLRSQIAQTKQHITDVKYILMPRTEVLESAKEYVALEGKKAQLGVKIANHKLVVTTTTSTPFAWLCAMFPDRVAEAIVEQAEHPTTSSTPGSPIVMSSADRDATRARLEAQLLMLERDEERLIQVLHSQGQLIHRRMDANPMAILGLTFAPVEAEPPPRPAPAEAVRSE